MRYALNEEKWTGDYWIDGKKIYQRVYHQTSTGTSSLKINVDDSEMETITKFETVFISNNVVGSNATGAIESYFSRTNHHIAINTLKGERSITDGVAIVQYTKTEGSES